jgi:hypothetical protein
MSSLNDSDVLGEKEWTPGTIVFLNLYANLVLE